MKPTTPRALLNKPDVIPVLGPELDPTTLIDADLFLAFAVGQFPVMRAVHVPRVGTDNDLSLPGGQVIRTVHYQHTRWLLVDGPGWRVRFRCDTDGETWAWVLGVTVAAVDGIASLISHWNEPAPVQAGSVEVTFCYQGAHGVARRRRRIDAPAWPDIAGNYSTASHEAVLRLLAAHPPHLDGRLVLLWGPPGTGKTTLLRALARHWQGWCQTVYVSDPDRLFGDPGYLNALVLDDRGAPEQNPPRWTLLVLEDCDELIRPDAKQARGQALSRLLNLTDGVIGQGLRVLVCLTTNEELWRLHPAVTRPGRCLAQLQVGRLDRGEAAEWLGGPDAAAQVARHVGPDGATLAELFALRNGTHAQTASTDRDTPVGQYL
ncbi:MAG: DUF5925 domain-containing protein [Acidimicrobiales bacterium]